MKCVFGGVGWWSSLPTSVMYGLEKYVFLERGLCIRSIITCLYEWLIRGWKAMRLTGDCSYQGWSVASTSFVPFEIASENWVKHQGGGGGGGFAFYAVRKNWLQNSSERMLWKFHDFFEALLEWLTSLSKTSGQGAGISHHSPCFRIITASQTIITVGSEHQARADML